MFYRDSNIDFKKEISGKQTPLVIYDKEQLEYTIKKMVDFFSRYNVFNLSYAVKSSYNSMYLDMFSKYGFGCDVAGINEFEVVKKYPFKFITTTSPYYSDEDMKTFCKENIIIDFNSEEQINRFLNLGFSKDIGIRVRVKFPDWALGNIGTYGNDSRFGIEITDKFLNKICAKDINIVSLHTHTGQMTPEMMVYKVEYFLKICEFFEKVEILNLGGGGLHLLGDVKRLESAMDYVQKIVEEFNLKNNREIKIIFEPGGALTLPFGYLVTSVVSKQKIRGNLIITVDSSAWNILPWNIYDVKNIDSDSENKENVIIAGCSLFEGDFFGMNGNVPKIHEIKKVSVGDRLLFHACGGYTYTNSRKFNSICLPDELIINRKG